MRGDGKGRIYTWGWRDGGWKAREEGKHSWRAWWEPGQRWRQWEGRKERKKDISQKEMNWTWWMDHIPSNNFNPDSRRGVGVTPHKMEDRALHCEALRIRALGGREGPGPQSTGFSSLTIQMRKQRPKEVKWLVLSPKTSRCKGWDGTPVSCSPLQCLPRQPYLPTETLGATLQWQKLHCGTGRLSLASTRIRSRRASS